MVKIYIPKIILKLTKLIFNDSNTNLVKGIDIRSIVSKMYEIFSNKFVFSHYFNIFLMIFPLLNRFLNPIIYLFIIFVNHLIYYFKIWGNNLLIVK